MVIGSLTQGGFIEAVIGMFLVGMFFLWIIAEVLVIHGKITRWLQGRTHADDTLDLMYEKPRNTKQNGGHNA